MEPPAAIAEEPQEGSKPPAAIAEEPQEETKLPDKEEEEKKKEVIKGAVISVERNRDRKGGTIVAAEHVAVDMPIEIEMFLTNFGSSCFSRFLIGQKMQLIVFLIISTVTYFASVPILLTYDCAAMTGDEWAAAGCNVPNPDGTCIGANCPLERNIGRDSNGYVSSSGLSAIQLDSNGDEILTWPRKYDECFIACYPESLEPESADDGGSTTTDNGSTADDGSTADKISPGDVIKKQLKQLKTMFEKLVPKDPPIRDGGKFRVIRELDNDYPDNDCPADKLEEDFVDVATALDHETLHASSETGITSRETCSDLELPQDDKYTGMKDLLEATLWTQGVITFIKSLFDPDGYFYLMIKLPKVPCGKWTGKWYPLKSITVFGAFLVVLASLASAVMCVVTAVISVVDGFNILFLLGLLFAGVVCLFQFKEEYLNMMKRKQKAAGKVAFGCAEAPPLTDEEKAALRTCRNLCIGVVILFACMIFVPVIISSPVVLIPVAIVAYCAVFRYNICYANDICYGPDYNSGTS